MSKYPKIEEQAQTYLIAELETIQVEPKVMEVLTCEANKDSHKAVFLIAELEHRHSVVKFWEKNKEQADCDAWFSEWAQSNSATETSAVKRFLENL